MTSDPGGGPRILVIRGGALGDFILTLPAIRLLRENFPSARLEILGYQHIVALAEDRYYADATRSIEYGPVAAFFSRQAALDEELSAYFASFQQIVSYLYDPDGIFDANLRRAGAKNILHAFRKIDDSDHAAQQLAQPLEKLALYLEDSAARVFPVEADRAKASEFLGTEGKREWIALHPGSGSAKKNWPVENWLALAEELAGESTGRELILIGGEADGVQLAAFEQGWGERPLRVARDLPLPHLAAILERCRLFLGHDSGISHLAAAVETPCVLLFGPTDPDVWKPASARAKVLASPSGQLVDLPLGEVAAAARRALEVAI